MTCTTLKPPPLPNRSYDLLNVGLHSVIVRTQLLSWQMWDLMSRPTLQYHLSRVCYLLTQESLRIKCRGSVDGFGGGIAVNVLIREHQAVDVAGGTANAVARVCAISMKATGTDVT